jgi:cytochrome c peroxidase
MRYRLLTSTMSLALLLVAIAAPTPVRNETPNEAPPSQHSSGHAHMNLINWEHTFLVARIFLDRLPTAMPGSKSDAPARIALGKKLYFERGISINKNKSCHDCHFLTQGRAGADITPTSQGATGISGKRNTPTVINAGFQIAQFWDGRAHNLAQQAKGPILNPIEMALRTQEEVIELLKNTEGYPEAFRRAFPGEADPVTFDNLTEAIAAFERTLVAPGRFDQLLGGQQEALTPKEKRGLTKFLEANCVECHTGATVGGQLYRIIGQRHPYGNKDDLGRYEITKKEEDRYVFKVPMLRNVTRTAPYFHDGRIFTLEEAVTLMGWHQLDHRLPPGDVADIIAFLGTLEGNPPPVEEPR